MELLIGFLAEIVTEEILLPIVGAGLLNGGRYWLRHRRSPMLTPTSDPKVPEVLPPPPPPNQERLYRLYKVAQQEALQETQRTGLIWAGGLSVSLYAALTPVTPENFDAPKVALLIILGGLWMAAVVRSSLAAILGQMLNLELKLNPQLSPPGSEDDTL